MSTKDKRQLDHLLRDGLEEHQLREYLQVVEELFGKEYLNSLTAKGALPTLWKRLDFIATNELITLGMAISNLKEKNNTEINDWLFSTAKAVKKHAKNNGQSNGFIREIIFCGSISNSVGNIIPAKKAQQGYDLEIKTINSNFATSLKKFGKSDNHKEFEVFCNQLANIVKYKAVRLKKNIQVCIEINEKLDEILFKRIEKVISNANQLDDIRYYEDDVLIITSKILTINNLAEDSASWQLNVLAPESKNEQSRFVKQIIQEISNMKKTLDSSSNHHSLRQLYVNVNENCNMESVQEKLVQHYKDNNDPNDDIGVDMVILHKSAICESGNSTNLEDLVKAIYHDIRPINFENNISPRMVPFIKTASPTLAPLQMNVGIGRFEEIPQPTLD